MPKEGGTLDELAILAVVPKRVDVYTLDKETDAMVTRTVRVAPMTLDICGQCAAAIRPIVESIGVEIRAEDLPLLVADHTASVRDMVASATGETPEYIGSLPLDQFLLLALAVWDVNRDFFVRHVGPMGKTLVKKMFVGVGPTSSTVLPNTDTKTP